MKPGKIAGATVALGAPQDWDRHKQGECDELHVRVGDGILESAWFPSKEELEALNEGAPVILTIWGRGHPPVSVNVELSGQTERGQA